MSTVKEFISCTLIFRIGQYLRYKFYRSKFRNWLRLLERQGRTWHFSTSYLGLLCNAETGTPVAPTPTSPLYQPSSAYQYIFEKKKIIKVTLSVSSVRGVYISDLDPDPKYL